MLVGFRFEHGEFMPKCSLPLPAPVAAPDGGSPLSTGRIAASGDVDGDGSDEIVVVGSRTIRKYELIQGAFALTAEAAVRPDPNVRPAWCLDVCIGDANRDGINEVLLAGVQNLIPYEPDRVNHPVTLYACDWTRTTLLPLWNDHRELHLDGPSWITPITKMAGVFDPANVGQPGLLMEEGKSDVRATAFDKLDWTPDGFRKAGYFVIRDGRIQWSGPDNPGGAVDRCGFDQVGGKTAILAQVIGDPWRGEYFVFHGDTATDHRVVWSDSDMDWWSPSAGVIIDLDGKGTGVLRFTYPRPPDGRPRFEFYRL